MNRPLQLLWLCCLWSSILLAQKSTVLPDGPDDPRYHKTCGFDEYYEDLARENPVLKSLMEHYRKVILPEISRQARTRSFAPKKTIYVPIVVHVIHESGEDIGEGSNLSVDRIQEQIDILNEDFRAENPEFLQTPNRWRNIIDTPSIQFCLAVVDPDGNPSNGITRDAFTITGTNRNNSNINQVKRATVWDSKYYYNIWTLPIPGTGAGGGVTGFATLPFPGTPGSETDGSVVDWRWFGGPMTGGSGFRTLTHETGHYLGLYHTFHDDTNCSVDDGLADTPLQAENTNSIERLNCSNGYPTGPSTCGPEHLYVNYMDYTTCETSFTRDQVEIMRAVLEGRMNSLNWASRKDLADNSLAVCTFYYNDASIADIQVPGDNTCGLDDQVPVVELQNLGIDTLLTTKIFYQVDNQMPVEFVWVDRLIPGERRLISLAPFTPPSPSYTFTAWTAEPNGNADERTSNDTLSVTSVITYPESGQLPLEEDFELGLFPTATGLYTNTLGFPEWEIRLANDIDGNITNALHCDNTRQGREAVDFLLTRMYDFTDITEAKLTFDLAYTYFSNGSEMRYDSLALLASTDCGNNFTQRLWVDGGESMATAPPSLSFFSPAQGQWRNVEVDLSQFDNIDNLTLAFVNYSGNGNTVYLDNINLTYDILHEAGLEAIEYPTDFECTTTFDPLVTIKNGGSQNLTELEIYYQINNDPAQLYNWTGNLLTGETEQVILPTINVASSFNLTVYVSQPNGEIDPYLVNDTLSVMVDIPDFSNLPFSEDFEAGTTLPTPNNMEAIDYSLPLLTAQWEIRTNINDSNGGKGNAIRLNNRFTVDNEGTTDGLLTPFLDFSSVQGSKLTFEYTYAYYSRSGEERFDTLAVLVSTDCGQTYPHRLFYRGGADLATRSPAGSYLPKQEDWVTVELDLSEFDNESNVRVQFLNISGWGLPVYLDNINIEQPCNISVQTDQVDVACFGDCDGQGIISNPMGGIAPYTYAWDANAGNQTTATATGLCPDQSYGFTVTDAAGCTTTGTVFIAGADEIELVAQSIDPLCAGENTGSASVDATGGQGGFTYEWSTVPVQTGAVATGLGAGTFTVTVTDAAQCSQTASVTLVEPAPLAGQTSQTNLTCNGGLDGTATALPSGGTGAYSYLWSDPAMQQTATATGLSAGTYSCTVTDANGCVITLSVTLDQPDVLAVGLLGLTPVSCNGDADGEATLDPSGGTGSYTYAWNDPGNQTTATATGLSAGTYTPTVTDANGCSESLDVIIDEPVELGINANITDPLCHGENTGSITVDPSGGTSTYTYSWSDDPIRTTNTATGLGAGIYTVTVTDANGCTIEAVETLTEPEELTGTIDGTDITCNGDNDGEIIVTADGGTGNLTYSWSDDPTRTTATASSLGPDTYTVSITDANGCSIVFAESLMEPDPLSVTVSTTGETFLGANDGTATANPNGGTGTYTYNWSSGGTTAAISSLSPTTYTVTITDENGCTATASGTVNSFTCGNLQLEVEKSDISCFGETTGTATANLTGGTDPVSYAWSLPANGATVNNLVAGTYTVTATDADGCSATSAVTIEQPTELTLNISSTDETFLGDNDGTATATVTGGITPYTYQWSNDSTTAAISSLSPGIYELTLTDANGCTVVSEVEIEAGVDCSQLDANFTLTDVSCAGESNGMIQGTASGGTAPYTWSWNTGQSGSDLSGLVAGDYTTTIMDANGCSIERTVTLTQPDPLSVSTTFTNETVLGASDGTATATATGGTPAYTYSWSNGETTAMISNLAPGTYTVTVTDANDCPVTSEVTISTGVDCSQLELLVDQTNISCAGEANGTIEVTPQGGEAPYTYTWNPAAGNTNNLSDLPAGVYEITVTDANDCETTTEIEITEPNPLLIVETAIGNVSCFDGNDGRVSVLVAGGTSDYTFSWSHNQTLNAPAASDLSAGDYTVTVTDENGCTLVSDVITISQPDPLNVSVNTISETMAGMNDGSAEAVVTGGTGNYTYAWNVASSDNPLTGLGAGTYTVTVTDGNGCTAIGEGTVLEGVDCSDLEVEIVATDISCFDEQDGQIVVDPMGGTAPYTYNWNIAGTANSQSGLAAGTYAVTVTDDNGCSTTVSADIEEPEELTLTSQTGNVDCAGDGNGFAFVSVTGGTGNYSYQWSNGGIGNVQTDLSGGPIRVTVTDERSCTLTADFLIEEPEALELTLSKTDETTFGANDGTASATANGGVDPYVFIWNTVPPQISPDIDNLEPGTYVVTLTDYNGCSRIDSVTIEAIPPDCSGFSVEIQKTDISCFGEQDGRIELNPAGGNDPYTFNWQTGPSSPILLNLAAANYTVTITDEAGCEVVETIRIEEPAELSLTVETRNANCGLSSNATVNPAGGTAPYTYLWSTGDTERSVDGLPQGTFGLTVTDANGCTTTGTAIIEPGAEGITVVAEYAVPTCHGDSDGFIEVNTVTGTAPFTYQWNTGETTSDLMDVPAGRYTLRITDANNCSFIRSFNLVEPGELSVVYTVLTPSDDASPDGVVIASAFGGTTPYTYTWQRDNTSGNTLDGVPTGTYYLLVTDANGCTFLDSVVVDLTSTGISNLQSLEVLELFPNPTISDLQLTAEFTRSLDVRFEVFDLTGKVIWSQEGRDSRFRLRIDLQDQPGGTYLLRLVTSEGYVVRKFVKL